MSIVWKMRSVSLIVSAMLISINPHKPVVKIGYSDNVVNGIFSFKVAILTGALQNAMHKCNNTFSDI
jgi:hypothetical protein